METTSISNLKINVLTPEQYETAEKNNNEIYLIGNNTEYLTAATKDYVDNNAGGMKVETGTYTGSGSSPTLTFSFAPKIVYITANGTVSNLSSLNTNWQSNCQYYGHHTYSIVITLICSGQSLIAGQGAPSLAYANGSSYNRYSCDNFSYNEVIFNNNTVTWSHNQTITGLTISPSGSTLNIRGDYCNSTTLSEQYNFYCGCYSGLTYNYTAIG